MKRTFFCLATAVSLMAFNASAQQTITVRKTGSNKATIDLSALEASGGTASRSFVDTLRKDLENSGYFAVTSGGGQFQVQGSARQSGANVSAQVRAITAGDKRQVFGKGYNIAQTQSRTLAHQVADEIVKAVTGREGMASGKIALVGSKNGKKELFTCDYDGSNLKQLSYDNSISLTPSWGPDGRLLTYTSYMTGFPSCFIVDTQTRRRSRISAYPGLNAMGKISPDGRTLALILSKDGNPELYLKDLRSGALKRLTETRATEGSPSWSPDGSHLVYVSDSTGRPHLYTISRNGGKPSRLTSRGVQCVAPDWGKNGWIAFSMFESGKFRPAIMNPKTREVRVLANDWASYEDLSWAPNGRHLVCTRIENYRSNLYRLDTLGDAPVALNLGAGDWFAPSWSR